MPTCSHLDTIQPDLTPSGDGCQECLIEGTTWVHLRMCQECGHIGCCDNSPRRHATGHWNTVGHPVIRSFEPGEDWYWCYPEELAFRLDVPAGPWHP